jgi:hypothetical protein
MADVASPHEKQIEQLQPRIEGAPEASQKIAGAKDAASDVQPEEAGSENEKLKIAAAGKEAEGMPETKIDGAADYTENKPINFKYANETYSFTDKDPELHSKYPEGVKFDAEGYPDFSPYAAKTVEIDMKGNYTSDFEAANKGVGLTETPDGYTWHHHQDSRTMELLPSDLHGAVRHTGGVSILEHEK